MWAFRRASIHLKNRSLSSGTTRVCCVKSEIASCYLENYNAEFTQYQLERRFHNTSSSSKSFSVVRFFSSPAGSEDHNGVLEDASSWLETRYGTVQEAASGDEMDDELISESELQNELEILDVVGDVGENKSPKTEAPSGLTKVILSAPSKLASRFLDEWAEAGNEVTRTEVSRTLLFLWRRRLFAKALELFEWLELRERLEYTESDYASRVDLVAKVQGISKAEEYIQQIPKSFRSEIVYGSLLKNYVGATHVNKTEELFNKMKNLFPLTCFSCNWLLRLYKITNRKKIDDIIILMEKENIKPSNVTYQILIDVRGQSDNISGVEQIFEIMKSNGVEPSLRNRASLAQYYAAGGLKGKAEAVLKDMEGGDLVKNHYACRFLLPVYALLGRDDEVRRIWKECESNPGLAECIAAMKAWGQLKRIEDAEAVFDKMSTTLERLSSMHYAVLLDVYANHKMLTEGEDLFRRMTESGVTLRAPAWDALVKLYVRVGEVKKAEAILEKAIQQRRGRPKFTTFLKILLGCAGRGDVHNAEKIFLEMRKAGYCTQPRPYHTLLYAYINAKAPADGLKERLRRDNVVPDKKLARLMVRVAAFRKSEMA